MRIKSFFEAILDRGKAKEYTYMKVNVRRRCFYERTREKSSISVCIFQVKTPTNASPEIERRTTTVAGRRLSLLPPMPNFPEIDTADNVIVIIFQSSVILTCLHQDCNLYENIELPTPPPEPDSIYENDEEALDAAENDFLELDKLLNEMDQLKTDLDDEIESGK